MRTFFDAIKTEYDMTKRLGEDAMGDGFPSENPMWRPVWAKAGCHCALGQYSMALGGFSVRDEVRFAGQFLGVGKISRGFSDGRMLGLHYQWGKSMIQFRRPHPAMYPLNPRVQIGEGFADVGWWGLPREGDSLNNLYTGWGTGEWMMSMNCELEDVPCRARTLHEWVNTE